MQLDMKSRFSFLAVAVASTQLSSAATVAYQFTGGSMVPIVTGLPAGVTASDFSIGSFTFANLSDNGGSGNSLRISGNDFTATGTGASFTANTVLSFSLTIPVGVTLDLTSITYDFTSAGLTGGDFTNARVFSNIDGSDDVIADTIGIIGVSSNGATSGTGVLVSLATPDSNASNGANSNDGDFDSLTNQTITFSMPLVRSAGTASNDFVDFDNITLNFEQVPEPSAALLGGLGLLALLRRRRA